MYRLRIPVSLILAAGAAYAFSCAVDLLVGGLTGVYPRSAYPPVVTWSLTSVALYFSARMVSHRNGVIGLPYFVFAMIAATGGVVGSGRDFFVAGALALHGFAVCRMTSESQVRAATVCELKMAEVLQSQLGRSDREREIWNSESATAEPCSEAWPDEDSTNHCDGMTRMPGNISGEMVKSDISSRLLMINALISLPVGALTQFGAVGCSFWLIYRVFAAHGPLLAFLVFLALSLVHFLGEAPMFAVSASVLCWYFKAVGLWLPVTSYVTGTIGLYVFLTTIALNVSDRTPLAIADNFCGGELKRHVAENARVLKDKGRGWTRILRWVPRETESKHRQGTGGQH